MRDGSLTVVDRGDPFDVAWRDRRADPRTTLTFGERLRDEAIAAGDELGRGRALTLVGACHLLRSDLVAALRALLEALPALEDGPPVDRARALSEAGFVDVMTGEHDSAAERLTDALRLYEAAGDLGGCADTLNRIGVAFYDHGDLDDADAAYHRALALRREVPDEIAVAGLHNNLGKLATARGDLEDAVAHLEQASSRFEAAGEVRGLGMVLHNLAVVELDRGRTRVAVELLERSIGHYDTSGHVHGSCEARTRLGTVLADRGDLTTAWPLLARAHEDAERVGSLAERARAAEGLADLAQRRGEPVQALAWMRRLRDVERALFDQRSESRFRALQVRFQLDRLERDSVTDALTGLRNRRGLDRALAELAAAHREDGQLAVLLLDLDDFKRINDTFSHSTGDEVLRAVGRLVRASTRPTDVCARYGGEEFVVLLPGCDHEAGRRVADELVVRIREHAWSQIAAGLTVTTSLGFATTAEVDTPERLLGAADRALYAAKHDGKDRVTTSSDLRPMAPPGRRPPPRADR